MTAVVIPLEPTRVIGGPNVKLSFWAWPPRVRDAVYRWGPERARGEITAADIEYMIGLVLRQCPPRLRGETAEAMLRAVDHAERVYLKSREDAAARVIASVKPLLIRGRGRDEIRAAATEANAGVLNEAELVDVVKEEIVVFRYYERRRRRWA